MYNVLDITAFKERDEKLITAIIQAVRDTQLFIIRDYPHTLLMTPEQFEMLKPDAEATPFDDLLYKLNKHPFTVMDVRVKGVYEGAKPSMVSL